MVIKKFAPAERDPASRVSEHAAVSVMAASFVSIFARNTSRSSASSQIWACASDRHVDAFLLDCRLGRG